MQIYKIYTIFDSKIGTYHNPFYAKSRGEAIRIFTEACNDSNSNLFKYPTDFTLFELGEYDDESAAFNTLPTPYSIGLAQEFIKVIGDK
jgi:hypothetical protein